MHDLKNLNCLLPDTIVEGINFRLFAISLLYIEDIEDDNIAHLEPVENVSKEKIRDFFEKRLSSR